MKDFFLPFDLRLFQELDNFALLADQGYNLGDKGDWFNCFRGGLQGMFARLHGVTKHHLEVHAWIPKIRDPIFDTEYHISSIFFNMDSALECFVFAINALGYAVSAHEFKDVTHEFKDVTDEKALREISPYNILGKSNQPSLIGYKNYFPNLQNQWLTNRDLLETIFVQHNVSKHREVIYIGGTLRNDPPTGFYENLGIANDSSAQIQFKPMGEIILLSDPKTPYIKRKQMPQANFKTLEMVAEDFREFIKITGEKALSDAKTYIKLKYTTFQNP